MSQKPYSVVPTSTISNRYVPGPALLAARPVDAPELSRVLIVDFRDEVFASLRGRLTEQGATVERALNAGDVIGNLCAFGPRLILINQEMYDETGCLIAHKLRLKGQRHAIWLYTLKETELLRECSMLCRIDRLIEYRGDLKTLDGELNKAITRLSATNPSATGEF